MSLMLTIKYCMKSYRGSYFDCSSSCSLLFFYIYKVKVCTCVFNLHLHANEQEMYFLLIQNYADFLHVSNMSKAILKHDNLVLQGLIQCKFL